MKIQKVLLINPQNTLPRDSVRRIATPLGLMYIGKVLKDKGYDVKIIDSPCEGYSNVHADGGYLTYGLSDQELKKRIQAYQPDIVGVSSMFTAHQKNAVHCCDLVKSVNKDTPVVLGGIHPSLFPEESISHESVDYVIIGEGDFRMLDLVEALNKEQTPGFDGVAFKKGGVQINPMIHRIENLNTIPFPARELVNVEDYIRIGVPYAPFSRRERVEQVMTSRGCPFNCVFCSTVNFWGRKFRTRSVENVLEEINELVTKYNIQEIQFPDDNMTVDKERAKSLFRGLKKYGLSWCTPHGLMIKTLDEEMIGLMAESGAYQLTFAVESGSERVLREIIHKDVPKKEEVKKLVNACHARDIQVHGLFVVGFPGETKSEILETLNYPFDAGFDSVSFFIANPIPGSELYRICLEKGYLSPNSHADFKSAEINIPVSSPEYILSRQELEALVDRKTREFNEQSRKANPSGWDEKFRQFLKKHGDNADTILGRVT